MSLAQSCQCFAVWVMLMPTSLGAGLASWLGWQANSKSKISPAFTTNSSQCEWWWALGSRVACRTAACGPATAISDSVPCSVSKLRRTHGMTLP